MKKCATCGKEYDEEYDGCPHCVTAKKNRAAIMALVVFALVAVVFVAPRLLLGAGSGGGITLSQFSRVQTGMTVQEVQSVMGDAGKLTVDQNIAGMTGQVYQWQNPGGSNVIVQFQNGKVIQKAQAGLQ
jgi:hypothetical protein